MRYISFSCIECLPTHISIYGYQAITILQEVAFCGRIVQERHSGLVSPRRERGKERVRVPLTTCRLILERALGEDQNICNCKIFLTQIAPEKTNGSSLANKAENLYFGAILTSHFLNCIHEFRLTIKPDLHCRRCLEDAQIFRVYG